MDVLDLYAKIKLDKSEYDKGLDDASEKSKSIGSKIGGGLATAAKIGTAAVGAAAGVVATFTQQAVNSFADYEQLVGGVETLFGDAAGYVQERASAAFETAGLSANEYMETVTSFSASLLQSLGGDTDKAAQVADQAIIDMSDNANKMGSSMESIQNAYQGFAKQNYTMLDNLKLGYGGTKEEMERLLDDAGKLAGTEFELGNYSDVIEAIHVVQENMGIAGTTAAEASTTISGSMASMKSAWQNTLTAIGEGDMSKISESIGNLVDTAKTFAGNIIPVIQTALEGISQLITELAPEIAAALPDMITKVLPSLLEAGLQIIKSLSEGIVTALPELFPAVVDVVFQLVDMLISLAPDLIQAGLEIIVQLALGIAEALPTLIPAVVEAVLTIAETLIDNIDLLIDAAIQIIIALAEGLIGAQDILIQKAPEIVYKLVVALIKAAPQLIQASVELIMTLVKGIVQNFGTIVKTGAELVDKVKNGFSQKVQDAKNWGRDIIQNFINGIKEKWEALKNTVSNVAQTVKDFLGFSEPEKGPLSNFHTYAPDMMKLFAKGIADNEDIVADQLTKSLDFGDVTGNVNVTGAASVKGGVAGTITINVYGAEGQDEARLAEIVGDRLMHELNMRQMAYA